ncbi:hypothetical protein D0962_23260 [Leptolyngbyaceae cyanobacterium CCMR0082]|uniref:Uncharacterized protein n=1 Tax=Adonisia turfae CCMR0082 TaxID=2304604 RepID=A0A6M0SAV8_9CYAN|nr:hypothetical protein [Adonisia turfae]NEZ65639.1 hypothetical protein [Adonisia turfae CCMR0082]
MIQNQKSGKAIDWPFPIKTKTLNITSTEDLDNMPLEAVEAVMDEIKASITKTAMAIGKAVSERHITGAYANPDWFGRATRFKKVAGAQDQLLQRYLGKRRKEAKQRQRAEFTELFIDKAREILPSEVFHKILQEAQQSSLEPGRR